MKSYLFFILGGLIALIMNQYLFNSTCREATPFHPEIKSDFEIYTFKLNDTISDQCFDLRHFKITSGDITIWQQCELDSNRYHINVKTK